jgi:DNA-binding response OmpR family regulator
MRAIVKNIAPQLRQSLTEPQPIRALCLDDSLTPMRSVDLKEVHQLSRFLPFVVLIPKSHVEDLAFLSKVPAKPLKRDSEPSKLLQQLSKTAQQYKWTSPEGDFVFGDAAVNFSAMEARHKGQPVALTALEFKILKYMIQNERRALSRNELLNQVWGYENYPYTRTVDNHILRLRQKFERDASRPVHFRTVHGFGYKFLSHGDQV